MYRHTAGHKRIGRRQKVNKIDKYVLFSLILLIIYSIIELILSTITGLEHTTLTTCVFSTFGGEILSCCLIKIFKLKGAKETYETEFSNEERLL